MGGLLVYICTLLVSILFYPILSCLSFILYYIYIYISFSYIHIHIYSCLFRLVPSVSLARGQYYYKYLSLCPRKGAWNRISFSVICAREVIRGELTPTYVYIFTYIYIYVETFFKNETAFSLVCPFSF